MQGLARSIPLLAWSGLLLGPLAWAINTQLGQLLPEPDCGGGFRSSTLSSALAVPASLLGAWLSYRVSGLRRRHAGMAGFIGSLGTMLGLLVAFALLLQALSTLLVSPCAR